MEALIEVLIQVIFEVFGELILTAITKLVGLIFRKIDTNHLLRRRLKFVLTYLFIGLIIVLLVSSMIHSSGILIIIALLYMLFQIVMTLLEIINQDKKTHPLVKGIHFLKKLSHYAFPILTIVFTALYIESTHVKNTIIILSGITLCVILVIDIYRYWRYQKRK